MVAALETVQPGAPLAPTSAPVNVETLLMRAVESGVQVESLERIMAMRRELLAEAARTAFFTALAGFQAECPVIHKTSEVKDRNGLDVRYRFASLDKIVETVRPHLQRHELSFTFSADFDLDNNHLIVVCEVHHALGHTEASPFRVPIAKDNFMNGAQHFGSASSYAKRYAFINALGILTGDEDDDAQGSEPRPAAQTRREQAASPAEVQPGPVDEEALRRQERAEGIAAMGLVSRDGAGFKVTTPSLLGQRVAYRVWRDTDNIVRCECAEFTAADDTRFRCEHIIAAKLAVNGNRVQEAAPAEPPVEETAEPVQLTREQLLEHVTALCVELGYDTRKQLLARSKAATHTDEVIRDKDIPSLDKLIQKKRDKLQEKVTAELARLGLDEEQMGEYVGANGGGGKALADCTLAEMRAVAETLEVQ